MKKLTLCLIVVFLFTAGAFSQTLKASHSQALRTGITTINLINGLRIKIEFNPEKGSLWFTGETDNLKMFITEYIPLSNPKEIGIKIGESYRLDNVYVNIEYKVLTIEQNRVERIWFRIASTGVELPQKPML